ncbi:unnamed protein product [Brassicogethes aeneus]|uniref:F-box domain-containing protein n=1 Tax=Brassicogethes aeneus TaxID=1431903 RepID=A0A9P0AXL5_BRAAE|nr:unnamed protein product [Brassicogethes aeneus]
MDCDSEEKSHLLSLPDCLMMILLSYLDSTSLYQMSRTNLYFKNIISDLSLWRYIDARKEPNTTEKVAYCADRVHEKTCTALFRAHSKKIGVVQRAFFSNITKFDNMKILALENQFIDGRYVKYSHFPRNLEELSLRESYIKMNRNFFKGSCERFTKLRVLILDGCHWTDCGFLMSIAKYESLEIISLVGCKSLDSDSIAYFGLARFGYQKLKIFDCRFTGYAQSILKSFVNNQSILAYYFQHDRSYKLDYGDYLMDRRERDGRKRGSDSHGCMQMCYSCSEVDDHTFIQFINVVGVSAVSGFPRSALYKDPYGPCTCGYKERALAERDVPVQEETAPELDDSSKCKRRRIDLPDFLTPSEYDDESSDDDAQWVPLDGSSGSDGKRPSGSRKRKGSKFRKLNHIRTHIVIDLSNHNNNVASIPEDIPSFPSLVNSTPKTTSESSQSSDDDDGGGGGAGPAKKRKRDGGSNEATPRRSPRVSSSGMAPPPRGDTDEEIENELTPEKSAAGGGGRDDVSPAPSPEPPQGPSNARNELPVAEQVLRRLMNIDRLNDPFRVQIISMENNQGRREEQDIYLQHLQMEAVPEKKIPLKRLSLRGYLKITDKILTCIKDLSLDLLDLTYTQCTVEGINNFLSYNPNCRIVHNKFCTCKPSLPF